MNTDDALEVILSRPQYRELMEALKEAKMQLSPEEWQEVSRALINNVEEFVAKHEAELSEGVKAVKTFRA